MKKQESYTINPIVREDCSLILKRIDFCYLGGKNILLTGAGGFLGQYIVYLIQVANDHGLGCNLYCVSLHDPNDQIKRLFPNDKISWEACDLTNSFPVKWLNIKFDYIFHAACPGQPAKFMANPLNTIDLNVNVTRKLLELANKMRARFIFFSSADIYGEMPEGVDEVDESYNGDCSTLNSRAIYRESKRMGETICSIFNRDFGVSVAILRISSLYGPGVSMDDSRVFGNFIKSALTYGKIKMLDSGESKKAFGYIADGISMIMQVAVHGHELVYNVGGVDFITIRELAEVIGKHCGATYEVPQEKSNLKHIGSDSRSIKLNLSRVLGLFDSFSFTLFDRGIARSIAWNKQEFGGQ